MSQAWLTMLFRFAGAMWAINLAILIQVAREPLEFRGWYASRRLRNQAQVRPMCPIIFVEALGWLVLHGSQLFVLDLKRYLWVAFQVVKPGGVHIQARIRGGNHVIAIIFEISQGRDSFFTGLAASSSQQEYRESLHVATKFAVGVLI